MFSLFIYKCIKIRSEKPRLLMMMTQMIQMIADGNKSKYFLFEEILSLCIEG